VAEAAAENVNVLNGFQFFEDGFFSGRWKGSHPSVAYVALLLT
jgi:predicted RNA binding protein YcfA (HicA-like mRNA interferase family)